MGDIDISNYLYFIFLLLSLVFGALGNKKKKNKDRTDKKESPGFLESLLNEFESNTSNREKRPEVEREVERADEPESPLSKGVDIASYAQELREKSKRAKRIETSFDEEEFNRLQDAAYSLDGDSGSDHYNPIDFDLRTAVINDAILNQPKI